MSRHRKMGSSSRSLIQKWSLCSTVTTTGDTTYDNDDLDDAIFRSFLRFFRSFVRFFVRSKIFQKIGRVAAMILVQKSSKSELSSRFLGRLKILATCPKSIKITLADSDLRKSLSAFDSMRQTGQVERKSALEVPPGPPKIYKWARTRQLRARKRVQCPR